MALSPPQKAAAFELLKRGPVKLSADHFTPLSRTPWAGTVIGEHYKDTLVAGAQSQRIGEAWEFSADTSFPSMIPALGCELAEVFAAFPEAVLSPTRARLLGDGAHGCQILVKLLDAAETLSLQVHPTDDDPNLQPNECGKPESWLVLRAAAGAGIYLGFARSMRREALRLALASGQAVSELLHFVPVKVGDYFEIQPGVPHAIGAGVTVLEPQRIQPGKTGKTYRLWDFARRYDASGKVDQVGGAARPLHIAESLPLIDPEQQVGRRFADSLRRYPVISQQAAGGSAAASIALFPSNGYYQTALFSLPAKAQLSWRIKDGYGAMVMLSGELHCGDEVFLKGQPALLAHAAMPLAMRAATQTEFAVVVPGGAQLEF